MSYKFNPFTGTFDDVGTNGSVSANQVSYDNTDSGLAATNVQDAIDEVQSNVETVQDNVDQVQTNLDAHINDPTDAHDASAISSIPSGNLSAINVQSALDELQTDVDTRALQTDLLAHINDTTDAHMATAIGNTPAGTISSTTVQAAINELDGDSQSNASAIANHIANPTGAHAASAISSIPSGNLSANNVQNALNELQTDIDTRALQSDLLAHINDTTDAHQASAIGYDNTTSGLTATTAQAAIDELDNIIDTMPNPIYYAGVYDASTNTPTLSDSDVGVEGALYRVNVGGTVDFGSGPITLDIGDSIVNNGTVWDKWDHSDQVLSVNGQTGAVQLNAVDIPFDPTNTGFPADVQNAIDTQYAQFYDHTQLANAHESFNINFDGTTSGLSATNVQDAIDEVVADSAANFANTSLSNLATTSINTDLIPNAAQAYVIGSSNDYWASLFVYDIRDGNNEVGISLFARTLQDTSSNVVLDFSSGVNFMGNVIMNVSDPVNQSDAATKNYVDGAISTIIFPVDSVNGQTGTVQLNALDIPYDNTSSGLPASDVQSAIDAIVATPPAAGANTQLSNLVGPTAINTDLFPQSGLTYQLGASGQMWTTIFVDKVRDDANEDSLDVTNRILSNTTSTPMLDFSGSSLNALTHKIINVVDPTNPQDAATKAYVDSVASGNAITDLTGDVTATGPGSAAATLATVNSNVGTFGSATQVAQVTVNAKGLTTAASNVSIQIAESQVTNLVSDLALKAPLASPALTGVPTAPTATQGNNSTQLATTAYVDTGLAGKQATGNYITALTGDATASGPGSAALTLATVNSNVGSFTNANITVNAKGLITAASNGTAGANTTLSNLTSPTAVNQHLRPGTNATLDLGTVGGANYWRNLALGGIIDIYDAPSFNSNYQIQAYASPATTPSGNSTRFTMKDMGNREIAVHTADGSFATGHLYLETGNSTGFNSGNILLYTGTSSATRGKIKLQDGSQGTVGHVWTQTASDGSGSWQAASGGGSTGNKETFVLSGTDITNQYIDLAQVAKTASIIFVVKGGGTQIEGASYDYSVSYTGGAGGKTRITFLNDLATGGLSALAASDIVQITYSY